MVIINLTQHPATPEQIEAGVVEPDAQTKAHIRRLLTFDELPSHGEITVRAMALAAVADLSGAEGAMIGGAPYLMAPLEIALNRVGLRALYAFSERVSVETTAPDGTVTKTNVFKHKGFVEA